MGHSFLPFLNLIIGCAVIVLVIQVITNLAGIKSDLWFSLVKAFFYGALACFIYVYSQKKGLFTDNAQDWLTVFTFILAVFEAVQNLFSFIKDFKGKN